MGAPQLTCEVGHALNWNVKGAGYVIFQTAAGRWKCTLECKQCQSKMETVTRKNENPFRMLRRVGIIVRDPLHEFWAVDVKIPYSDRSNWKRHLDTCNARGG